MDSLLNRVLRTHPEPCTYLGDGEVHEKLTARPSEYVRFVTEQLEAIAAGDASVDVPAKQVLSDGPGDFRVMPCLFRRGADRLRTVKIVGTNTVQHKVPDQVTVGRAFRLDGDENYITHMFDACLLTSARTGVCAAVALSRLADHRRAVGVVGAGRVGFYSALYAATVEGVEEIVVHDLHAERAEAAVELLHREVENGVRFRVGASRDIRGHEALVLCTTAEQPFLDPTDVTAGLVVSTGADASGQRELGAAWAHAADIYVDSLDSLLTGDLSAWSAEGVTVHERAVDLIALVRDGPLAASSRRRAFISTGSALFDNLTVGYLLLPDSD